VGIGFTLSKLNKLEEGIKYFDKGLKKNINNTLHYTSHSSFGNERSLDFCSRLEGYANKNQIIISEEVNELVMDKFETNKLYIPETERLKSFKNIDHVYEIIRPKF
jgi:hypothetical protein